MLRAASAAARVAHSVAARSVVTVSKDAATKIAVLTMARPPVNSLNVELLEGLGNAIATLGKDREVQALVLASAQPGIFSAGLDINAMHNARDEDFRRFWRALQSAWHGLYSSRLVTVAAIDGHAPAGGCLLSIACDLRVMRAGKFTIGLNETKLGIVAPPWFAANYAAVIGQKAAERALMLGSLFSADEALRIGLVDELVAADAGPAAVLERAKVLAQPYVSIAELPRHRSKMLMRTPALSLLGSEKACKADEDATAGFVLSPMVQKSIGAYLAALAARKK